MPDTPIVLTWDYRQQPDLDDLASAVREISGETCHIRAVDTGSQEYAIVVSRDQLAEDEAQEAYLAHLYRDGGAPAPAPAQTVLYGVRCTDPDPIGHQLGRVVAHSQDHATMASLAANNPCYELVTSRDRGKTWQVT